MFRFCRERGVYLFVTKTLDECAVFRHAVHLNHLFMRNLYACLFLFFTLYSVSGQFQNQDKFWYFGYNAGLNFNTAPPTPLSDGALRSLEGCSSISDSSGNLLFYSDGRTAWNRNHLPMLNGTGLLSNPSSAQSVMILPDLQVNNRFFLITVSPTDGVNYSIIDMTLDTGLGGIVPGRKNLLIRTQTQEKITAIPGAAGSGIVWIIIFDNGQYHAYRVGGGLVNVQSLVTSTIPLSNSLTDDRGIIKASPDGTKIINTSVGLNNPAILTSFNNNTGVVSNAIPLTTPTVYKSFYGAEFSPNSRFVYLNGNTASMGNGCGGTNQREILQYDMFGSAGWYLNPIPLGGSTGSVSSRGSLQLAPNGKIYFARACQPFLGSIDNPNVLGTRANYIDDAIALAPGTTSREGLPNLIAANYVQGSNTVMGQVRLDFNGNGCDSTDPIYSNLLILLQSGPSANYDFTDGDGHYNFNVANGSHGFEPRPENPTYWNFSPANFSAIFPAQSSMQSQNFCAVSNGSVSDLEVVVVPLELARPGFVANYKIIVKNKGNIPNSGTVTLDFENAFMTLQSSSPVATTAASNRLSWTVGNLLPFQMQEFSFSMLLNTPTATTNPLNDGDNLLFTGNVSQLAGTDAIPADNVMVLNQAVVNSFDPNDKTCLEGETIDPSMVGEYLHYRIRFENTGTASAVNVVVKDVIDVTKFDIATLVPLGGSHDYYTRIRESNVVEFVFEDINLDFNDATNDGYVLFKIKTLNTLVTGDTFDNTAQIYFDFNFPIITNTETVSVISTAGIGRITDTSIQVYPNPATGFISITAASPLEHVLLQDLNGRLLSQTAFIGKSLTQQVALNNLSSGIYFVTITSNSGTKIEKLIVQ